jgi:hypothetical protein
VRDSTRRGDHGSRDLVDDGGLARRYGLGDAGAVPVRPDGHCGPALRAVDVGHLTALTDAVDAVLGTAGLPLPTVRSRPSVTTSGLLPGVGVLERSNSGMDRGRRP